MWGVCVCVCVYKSSSDGKASNCNAGDPGSIPGSGRSPGEGNGNPLQYSCLENPMDRWAWQAVQSMGSQRIRHDWATKTHTYTHTHIYIHCKTTIPQLKTKRTYLQIQAHSRVPGTEISTYEFCRGGVGGVTFQPLILGRWHHLYTD